MFVDGMFSRFNRRSPIIVQTPWIGGIGNCAEDIYFGLLRARREGKKVFFVFPRDCFWRFRFSKVSMNRELLRVVSNFRFLSNEHWVSVASGWVLSLVYFILRMSAKALGVFTGRVVGRSFIVPEIGRPELWCSSETLAFSREKAGQDGWGGQFREHLPVDLPASSRREGERVKKEMGISDDEWFVCLHVREGGYYGYKEGKGKRVRNASIWNYLSAVQLITDAGGWVIRMGDPTMVPLPEMERVIDYARSCYKSDLMDIFLLKECRFYIGVQSGIIDVASLFQRPIITTNMCEWQFYAPMRKGDLGIPKHIFSHSKGRFLSVRESLSLFSSAEGESYSFFDEGYDYVENTPEEIRGVVAEFIAVQGEGECSELQREWNRLRIAEGYRILESKKVAHSADREISEKYHLAAYLAGCEGAIGSKFLEENWEWDRMNDLVARGKSPERV